VRAAIRERALMIRRLLLAILFTTTATLGLAVSHAAAEPFCIGTYGVGPNFYICTPG
jgi:hypothetical protein